MFTPGKGKSTARRVKDAVGEAGGSPAVVKSGRSASRPPASPWPSPSANAARAATVLRSGSKGAADGNQPVFVCDFPHQLRTLYADGLLGSQADAAGFQGGMDGKTGLSWVLHGDQLCVWSHLRSNVCCVLTMPKLCMPDKGDSWLVCLVGHQTDSQGDPNYLKGWDSVSVVMCTCKSVAVVYWSDVFADGDKVPVVSRLSDDSAITSVSSDERPSSRRQVSSWTGVAGNPVVTSMVASATSSPDACVAIAGWSNGELWRFDCSVHGILRERIVRELAGTEVGYSIFGGIISCARSVVWRSPPLKGSRQLLLLTAQEIECWDVELAASGRVSKAWTFDLSNDKMVMYDLAGQKQVWLLDLQVDESGKEFTMLVASFSKDRVTSSSYMQYSLHYFQQRDEYEISRKAPPQVILPKARVEEEAFLYSMRLRIGGQPAGSALILAGDGTATVTHVRNGSSVRLYQFDLAWGAGKVLDACVVPADDAGAWLVLTEQAGVWAIPEKGVLVCSVEPPERSLSRRGSSLEEAAKEERRRLVFGDAKALRRVSSETGVAGEKLVSRVVSQRPLQDEEAEATVGRLFQQFLASGQMQSALDKLQRAGAFEREGDRNVFARTSRALVDTLAKHWTSGGSGLAVIATVSSQLAEKQRRHQQYLNFLAASKCHQELQQKQSMGFPFLHGLLLNIMLHLLKLGSLT